MQNFVPANIRTFVGSTNAANLRVAIVASRFNSLISEPLLLGAVDALLRSGAQEEHLTIVRVSGAFEIPSAVAKLLAKVKVDAVITLGCLIRGDTDHYELIAKEVSKGIATLSVSASVPVVFGVLTTDTLEQAMQRAGGKAGNKGAEAALAAIEQANLFKAIEESSLHKA